MNELYEKVAQLNEKVAPIKLYENIHKHPTFQNNALSSSQQKTQIKEKIEEKKAGIFSSILTFFGFNKKSSPTTEENKSVEKNDLKNDRTEIIRPKWKNKEFLLQELRDSNRHISSILEEKYQNKNPLTSDVLFHKILFYLLQNQRKIREQSEIQLQHDLMDHQEDVQETQRQKMRHRAEIEALTKKSVFSKTIQPILQGGSYVGFGATASMMVTGAATIASGGTLAPLLLAANIVTAIFTGAQAINGFIKNLNDQKIQTHQGESFSLNESKKVIEMRIQRNLEQLNRDLQAISLNMETLGKILRQQQEERITFR